MLKENSFGVSGPVELLVLLIAQFNILSTEIGFVLGSFRIS